MPPLFDFECGECDTRFESLSKPTDPVECPNCRMRDCTKLISSHGAYFINGDNSASTRPKSG